MIGTGAFLAAPSVFNSRSPNQELISFEQAFADKSFRQAYIVQLVSELLGEEAYAIVKKFVYDEDGSQTKTASLQRLNEHANDPRCNEHIAKLLQKQDFLDDAVDIYLKTDKFSGTENRSARIKEFLSTPNGALDFNQYLVAKTKQDWEDDAKFELATTLNNVYDIGLRKRSDIFLRGKNIFEPYEYKLKDGKKIIVSPTKERLASIIKHEFLHALDHYYGIGLGDGLVIDNSNHTDVHFKVKEFMVESRAWNQDIRFLNQFNSFFGRYHPAFVDMIFNYSSLMEGYLEDLRDPTRQLSQLDMQLVQRIKPMVEANLKKYQDIISLAK